MRHRPDVLESLQGPATNREISALLVDYRTTVFRRTRNCRLILSPSCVGDQVKPRTTMQPASSAGVTSCLRTDAAVMSSMGWEVGEEAKDAIAWIEGRPLDEDAYTRSRKRRDHEI